VSDLLSNPNSVTSMVEEFICSPGTPGGLINCRRSISKGGPRKSTRHNPGTLGTRFPGAPDTIRTCDLCLSGLARNPSPAPAGPLPRPGQFIGTSINVLDKSTRRLSPAACVAEGIPL